MHTSLHLLFVSHASPAPFTCAMFVLTTQKCTEQTIRHSLHPSGVFRVSMSIPEFHRLVYQRGRQVSGDLESQHIPPMKPHRPLVQERATKANNRGSFGPNPPTPGQPSRRQSPVMVGTEATEGIAIGRNRQKTEESSSGSKEPIISSKLHNVSDHHTRVEQVSEYLKPLTKYTLLLCWGKEQCAYITPVFFDNSVGPDAHWAAIRHTWYGERSCWKEWLPLYGVQSVLITEV